MTNLNRPQKTGAILLFCAAVAIGTPAQTVTTLASFNKTNGRDPGYPAAPLVQGTNGNFYGTTAAGGASDEGTVFVVTPAGKLHTLYSFCSQSSCSDGAVANAGLMQSTDGNFYGTTALGGTNNFGTAFKITAAGDLTTIYRFCAQSGCADGINPAAGLLPAFRDTFYGTTYSGGASGEGTIFETRQTGIVTTLASFDGTDGTGPDFGSLIRAINGNFYGTTIAGGPNVNGYCTAENGCGTVFVMTPTGQLNSLYSFCSQPNCADGQEVFGGLVEGTNHNFYGTTALGGANGCGTVFELTPTGKLTTLHSFNLSDGGYPEAALVLGTDGNFYGTTPSGGTAGDGGTIFQITPAGKFTTLYTFCTQPNCSDGTGPFSSLIQATNGNFYGATFAGGTSKNCIDGCGTIFSLSMGLGPFIETRLTTGKVTDHVTILGNNLTGASAVFFNGHAAQYDVVSDTEIQTTVPAGATDGFVTVSTLNGKLTSNQPFIVIP
jgi:uncharacterized repeat protein (TIGR03803 family)